MVRKHNGLSICSDKVRRSPFPIPHSPFPKLGIILIVLLITGIAIYFVRFNNSRTLIIKDSVYGKVYGKWPLDETGEFAIEFIHSVNMSPVRETFIAEDRIIRLHQVRFSSFGAGMLSDLEEGLVMTRDEGAMVISGFNTSFKKLTYIVGTVSDHLFYINDETVSLRDLCGRNANITIQVNGK